MADTTANAVISMPTQLFTLARSFKANANGKIYIGKVNTYPVSAVNQIPVFIENQNGSLVRVAQPIIINAGGYPVYNGQVAKFVTLINYSMAVLDASDVQQFYFSNLGIESLNIATREALRRTYAEAGYNMVAGSFEMGGTVVNINDVLLYEKEGKAYSWGGTLPKVVASGSSPHIGTDAVLWSDKSNTVLIDQIAAHNNDASAHPQLRSFITSEANRAETAANAAAVTANVFDSTASGIAGTTNGQYFSVVSPTDNNYLDLYRNASGVATYQKSYPSTALVNQLSNASNKLTGSSGFSADGSDGMSTIEVPVGERKALVIGGYDAELLTFNTIDNSVGAPLLRPQVVNVESALGVSDSLSGESENTEDLIPSSSRAKVIGDGKYNLIFDTEKGELRSTLRIVDVSQNKGISLDSDVPDIITGVPAGYQLSDRLYQATPTIARTGSRFWLAWRADDVAGEAPGNYFVIGYSDDNCNTVTESHILKFSNNNHQIVDPMLWLNPESKELWLFWGSFGKAQAQDGICGCWCSVLENPEAKRGFSWSRPYKYRNIGDPRRPVRIAGKWMQCIDMWRSDAAFPPLYPETAGCEFVEFNPLTKTTINIGHNTPNNPAGGGTYSGFFETELLQLTDGRLMSTTRGLTGTELTRSFSSDGGATWTAQAKYSVLGDVSSSRIWLGRTPSGRVIIVYNNDFLRRSLTIRLSEDDGETFPYSVVLEGADTPETVSYPIVAFDGDTIYTTYDYGRGTANEIRVTITKESEIVAGTAVPDINIISGPTA